MPGNTNNNNEDNGALCPADSTDNGRGGQGDGGGGGEYSVRCEGYLRWVRCGARSFARSRKPGMPKL